MSRKKSLSKQLGRKISLESTFDKDDEDDSNAVHKTY